MRELFDESGKYIPKTHEKIVFSKKKEQPRTNEGSAIIGN